MLRYFLGYDMFEPKLSFEAQELFNQNFNDNVAIHKAARLKDKELMKRAGKKKTKHARLIVPLHFLNLSYIREQRMKLPRPLHKGVIGNLQKDEIIYINANVVRAAFLFWTTHGRYLGYS